MLKHTHARAHTYTHPLPFMVAKELLPMRAWFTAVLTPIIVFLEMRRKRKLPLSVCTGNETVRRIMLFLFSGGSKAL